MEFSPNRPVSLRRIAQLLKAEILTGEDLLDRTVARVTASDMMSSVLAHAQPETLLLTGLSNVQVINTAEVAGLSGVVFLAGIRPPTDVIQKARRLSIPTFRTALSDDLALGRLSDP